MSYFFDNNSQIEKFVDDIEKKASLSLGVAGEPIRAAAIALVGSLYILGSIACSLRDIANQLERIDT